VVKVNRDVPFAVPDIQSLPPHFEKDFGGILILSHQFHPAGFAQFAFVVSDDNWLSGRCPFCGLVFAIVAWSALYAGFIGVNELDIFAEIFFSASSRSLTPEEARTC